MRHNATLKPNQIAVLEAALEPGAKKDIRAICKSAGVDHATFYRWLNDDEVFSNAWANLWKDAIGRHLPGIVASMVDKAQSGDVAAARLLVDVAGIIIKRSTVEVNWREEARKAGYDDAALFEQMVNNFGSNEHDLARTGDARSVAGTPEAPSG